MGVGTWEATGGITDSGTYERTGGHSTGSIPDCFCNFVHTGAFEEEFLLTGSHGTLTVKAEERALPADVSGKRTGVWQIESGTDAYDRVSGHGNREFLPESLTLVLTGVISKAD